MRAIMAQQSFINRCVMDEFRCSSTCCRSTTTSTASATKLNAACEESQVVPLLDRAEEILGAAMQAFRRRRSVPAGEASAGHALLNQGQLNRSVISVSSCAGARGHRRQACEARGGFESWITHAEAVVRSAVGGDEAPGENQRKDPVAWAFLMHGMRLGLSGRFALCGEPLLLGASG